MKSFEQYLEKKKREFGDQFSTADLAPEFVQFFESGRRIEVQFPCGTVKRGTVGVTTGWKPAFILMLQKNSRGSSWLIDSRTKILRVIG